MTIIAYKDNVLVTDSRVILSQDVFRHGNVLTARTVEKMRKLYDNAFAVAVTGQIPDEDEWAGIEAACCLLLSFLEIGGQETPWHNTNLTDKFLGGRQSRFSLVMTRDGTYMIGHSVINRIHKNDFIAFGSGEYVAQSAMEAGKTAYEAVELACRVKYSCGGPIKYVTRSELSEFADEKARAELKAIHEKGRQANKGQLFSEGSRIMSAIGEVANEWVNSNPRG